MFAARMPMWCHTKGGKWHCAGDPLSWRHFRYGMAYLGRDEIGRTVQQATANRVAGAVAEDYIMWRTDMVRLIR